MAIKHPTRDPSNCEGCMEALQKGFDLLTKEASWAGWDVEATAQALLDLAAAHKRQVEFYRDSGTLPR